MRSRERANACIFSIFCELTCELLVYLSGSQTLKTLVNTMSSQHKFVNPQSVYWSLYVMRLTTMITFIRMIFYSFEDPSWLNIITCVILFGYAIQFHVLQLFYTRKLIDETYGELNRSIEKVNALPRRLRRSVISKFEQSVNESK
jgi:glucan phosphoethanolaminetransferase (alkaline phosphatase superfamily)